MFGPQETITNWNTFDGIEEAEHIQELELSWPQCNNEWQQTIYMYIYIYLYMSQCSVNCKQICK